MMTVFASVCAFLIAEKAAIASSVIARGTYDVLKSSLPLETLMEKIKSFFKDGDETENFVKKLCENPSINPLKPFRDVEDAYEDITGKAYNTGLSDAITKWVENNKAQIESVAQVVLTHNTGITVGTQTAGKNLYNISGDFKPGLKD